MYDVTRRETLSSLSGSWMRELALYDPHPEVARMVVANKVDQVGQTAQRCNMGGQPCSSCAVWRELASAVCC